MKRESIICFLMMSLLSASAQVPQNILKEFKRQQPGAKFIEWNEERGKFVRNSNEKLYRVTYTNWFRQSMVYNTRAQVVYSESELPLQYIPSEITKYIHRKFPNAKYNVWDSFDENNQRSYFVICNESVKVFFSNNFKTAKEVPIDSQRQKKQILLSAISE